MRAQGQGKKLIKLFSPVNHYLKINEKFIRKNQINLKFNWIILIYYNFNRVNLLLVSRS